MRDPIMCRPVDRENERNTADFICQCASVPLHYHIADRDDCYDFSLWGPSLYAIVEVKTRNMFWGEFATIWVSEKKLENCIHLARNSKCKFFFVVKCHTGVYLAHLESITGMRRELGGRRDRKNVSTDQEMMIHVPIVIFKKVGPPVRSAQEQQRFQKTQSELHVIVTDLLKKTK